MKQHITEKLTTPPADLRDARWIGLASPLPAEQLWQRELMPFELKKWYSDIKESPGPQLRKEFVIPQGRSVREACFDVCALGYFQLSISGTIINDCGLNPAVTDFSKRRMVMSLQIDPATFLPGVNVIGLWLGRGWYARGLPGVEFDGPVVKAALRVTLDDGSSLRITTDASWRGRPGPVRPIGTYDFTHFVGEELDLSQEQSDWDQPGANVAAWHAAKGVEPANVLEVTQQAPMTHVLRTLSRVSWSMQSDGSLLGDLGQCVTGQLDLHVTTSHAGQIVTIEYADKFKADGSPQTFAQADRLIASGAGVSRFTSQFDYHAFRYVLVRGIQNVDAIIAASVRTTGTHCTPVGEFRCSDERLNAVHDLVQHTFTCLLQGGVLQDCPHRERLGYGDGQCAMESAICMFDVRGLLQHWYSLWEDCQDPITGDVKHTAPSPIGSGGGPAWSAAGVRLSGFLREYYNDLSTTRSSLSMARGLLGFLRTKVQDGFLCHYGSKLWGFLGDWVAPGKGMQPEQRVDASSTQLFNNCYYILLLDKGAELAEHEGDVVQARTWRSDADALRALVHERWFDAANRSYGNGEPTYLVMPLVARVVPTELIDDVERTLRHRITVTDSGHLNTGMLGSWFMIKLFIERGWNDLILEMVRKQTFPGWGYMIAHGATAVWEEWNGDNSQIHSCHLSIGQWFYQGVAGIRTASDGFALVTIKPAIDLGLEWFTCKHRCALGEIALSWDDRENARTLSVTLPGGCVGELALPAGMMDASGICKQTLSAGTHTIRVSSGGGH